MAVKNYPAAPQTFTFTAGTTVLNLQGELVSFHGADKRRSASHVFVKRDGGRKEDMGRATRRLEVMLQFVDNYKAKTTAVVEYTKFLAAVQKNPSGLLVHPISGQWYAFCEGPDANVDFNRALNQIEVRVAWEESELDATVSADVPDVATAAQNATTQLSQLQQAISSFMTFCARATTVEASLLNKIAGVEADALLLTAPVDATRAALTAIVGAGSSIIGTLSTIQAHGDLLFQDVTNYLESASDLFNGVTDTTPAGASDALATLLGVVENDAQALEDVLTGTSPTPAGAGEAVANVELMLENCLTVSDAAAAAQPPSVNYTVPQTSNLVIIATQIIEQWGLSRDPVEYAAAIGALNRASSPARVPAGTVLSVPAR